MEPDLNSELVAHQFLGSKTKIVNEKVEQNQNRFRIWDGPGHVENNLEKKTSFQKNFPKVEVICRVLGLRVGTNVKPSLDPFKSQAQKMDPDPGLFTYRDLNKDPNPVISRSESLSDQRIGDPFTSPIQ